MAFTAQIKKKEEKIESKREEPKKEEIKKEVKEDKKKTNEIPSQPSFAYMMMYPYIPNQKESKPTMTFMIPMYCVETKNMPQNFPMPTMPQMAPMPGMPFQFYPYPPFGMNMQQFSENK